MKPRPRKNLFTERKPAAHYPDHHDGPELGLEQINHPFGNTAFIATTLVGLFPIARQALRLMKSGSWFAIETLMSVAAIGALFIGATAEAAMVLLLFLIGERLEGWAASRARKGSAR